MGDLTNNFSRKEFECPCGCGLDDIDINLVVFLQAVRDIYGNPIKVNSGVRCWQHNAEVGGKKTSEHLTGNAVDVHVDNSTLRFLILSSAFNAGFKRIGIDNGFIHLGNSADHPQEVAWMY